MLLSGKTLKILFTYAFGLLGVFLFLVIGDSDQECVQKFFFKEIFIYSAVLGCGMQDL